MMIQILKVIGVVLVLIGCASYPKKSAIIFAANGSEKIMYGNDIGFHGASVVSNKAFHRAQYIVDQMLSHIPSVRMKMQQSRFKIEIIGKDEVLSDRPHYSHLKGKKTRDGRDYDTGTRGIAGKAACSIGEENLLCLPGQPYYEEDILIHEFAHCIKYYLSAELSKSIDESYKVAKSQGLYSPDIYMMANSHEYWAVASQAWFDASVRNDVNAGINTRQGIKSHDPAVAAILHKIYGVTEIKKTKGCKY